MKLAVTGASGFVGRHVLAALAAGADVDLVASSRRLVAPGALPHGVRHVPLDMGASPDAAFDKLGRPDVLVHLAWSGLPHYGSLHHFETELPNQYTFLKSLVLAGLPSLVVVGTCYEYGMVNGELTETMPASPGNPYAHAKHALHQQLAFLRARHPFALTWARLFYMYGDGQATTSLFAQLSAAVARGDTSFAMSRGEQLRDFLPVENVARYIADLATHCRDAGIVNVCSGVPVSVRRLVEQLIARNAWSIALDLGRYPYPVHEPLAFWGSTGKLRSLLGTADQPSSA